MLLYHCQLHSFYPPICRARCWGQFCSLYILPLGPIILCHLYADDIQLHCSFHVTLSHINCLLSSIKQWLRANFLQPNSENWDCSRKTYLPCSVSLGAFIQPSLQNLGVVFDSAMCLEHHINKLIGNCFFQLRNTSKNLGVKGGTWDDHSCIYFFPRSLL